MAIYEVSADQLKEILPTSFSAAGIKERQHLQRLLREQIRVISPGILVISEEFGDWDSSSRRIDLLGLDEDANLVVIELKRTEDGGHMELQALRYAAMISTMTFEQAVKEHAKYLAKKGDAGDPEGAMLEFLGWDDASSGLFATKVRIILASAEFSKELTTAVLWLNNQGLNIECVRLKPYRDGDRTLIDVQQIIPLPEARDYQVLVRNKVQEEVKVKSSNRDLTRFDVTINQTVFPGLAKRAAIFQVARYLVGTGITPDELAAAFPQRQTNMFRSVEGKRSAAQLITELSEAASAGQTSFEAHRFYCDDDELMSGNGRTYAFTKMWGRDFLPALEAWHKRFPAAKFTCRPSDVVLGS